MMTREIVHPSDRDTALATRLRLVAMRLARRLRQQSSDGDVSPSMLSVLVSLDASGAVTLGELADIERVQPPTISRVIARLEERGLVSREADSGDRRVARVRLSTSGSRFVARSRRRKNAYLVRRLQGLDPEDVAKLEEALPVLEKLLGKRA
jgi:DNA-binding MarR family transcriptional regulator